MKDSTVMEIAVAELTGVVNQIAQRHNINPTLMRFVMSTVMNKLNEMAVSELSEEVVDLEIKIAKAISKTDDKPIESKPEKHEPEKVELSAKSKSERKSGTIEDLINNLKASGVKVTEKRVSSSKEGETTEEPTGENNEVTK